jgi:hypothetical protein
VEDKARGERVKKNIARYALIIPAVTLLFTASCSDKKQPKEEARKAEDAAKDKANPSDPVSHKVLSFNLEGLNEKGAKKWDVKGETAEAISENEIRLDNIVAKSYGEEAEAVITADQGVYDRSKNNVRLQKNVKATIEATQGFAGDMVEGAGSQQKQQDPRKGKKTKTVITCDGEVQFDYEKNQAYFLKNVKVVSEDGNIDADKITMYIDADTRQLKEIVAEGNVKITRGENTTYSDKAKYSEKDKKITLMGRPKLVIYQEGAGFGADFIGGGKK